MTRARDLGDFIADGAAAELVVDTTTLVVDSTNNRVGIGTASPDGQLHLFTSDASITPDADADDLIIEANGASGITIGSSASSVGSIRFADSGSPRAGMIYYDHVGNAMRFYTVATERLRIDSSGNVGIGTTDPRHIVDVEAVATGAIPTNGDIGASDANQNYFSFHNSSNSATFSGLSLETRTSGASKWLIANEWKNTYLGDLVFRVRNGGSSSGERFRFGSAGQLGIGGATYGTSGQILTSGGSGAAPSWADAAGGGGTVDFTASGSLSNGDLVKLNSNGTVSVVAGGGAGSEATFANTNCSNTVATFDSNLNKVVVGYKDGGNSNYGTAVVGTISGSSISFGTPVVFETAHANGMAITFDSNSNKVVIVYRDVGNNNYGTAIVGTVSGTSISFGSHVVWETNLAVDLAATFDSNSNKVVIAYRDYGNSNHGTAIIGTVSGTSISFGSKVVFNAAASEDISATFDSNSNKVVIAYRDDGNSYYGTAIVGTVSGTSISFGSEVVFNSRQSNHSSCTFDSNSNKVVIAYKNVDDGQRGEAVVGTVSGTSISFGAPVEFQGAGGKVGDYVYIVFDSGSNQVIIAYTDTTSSPSVLSVIMASVNGTSLNLKPSEVLDTAGSEQLAMTFDSNSNSAVVLWSKNTGNIGTAATYKPSDVFEWIGFASADVSNGATATINVVSSINEGQSSLTVGAKYYLPDSGTLSTASVSGREVGFATAATKLLITQGSVS